MRVLCIDTEPETIAYLRAVGVEVHSAQMGYQAPGRRRFFDAPHEFEIVDRRTTTDDAERLELVLRFFAFSDRYDQFSHHVAAFIDEYIADMNRGPFPKQKMMAEFRDTMTYVKDRFPYGFRKSAGDDRVPRVRFEAIAVGVSLAMRQEIVLHPDLLWLDTP